MLERAGWDVTDAEISVYDSPWEGEDNPEATVTLTARKPFPGDEDDGEEDGDSRFRVK